VTVTEPFKAIEAATPGQIALIFQSAGLPADSMLLEDIDTSGGPVFNVTQAGKVFFGRSGHWIRWREREGDLRLDGEQVGVGRRSGKDGRPDGYRAYSLTDIEQMAHALAQNGAIDGTQLLHTLRVVQAMARIYGYLPPEWEPEPVVGDDELD
jgi:hypothetical protein